MNKAMPVKQLGMSMSGFMFGAAILIFASITGLKLVPAYMQNATIVGMFKAIAADPEMQKGSLHEIRNSFIKRSTVEHITAIQPEDIEITKDGGRLVLSASYSLKVPLAGNVSLYLEFNPTSAK